MYKTYIQLDKFNIFFGMVMFFITVLVYFHFTSLYVTINFYGFLMLLFLYTGFIIFTKDLLAKKKFGYSPFKSQPTKYLNNVYACHAILFSTPDFLFTYLTKVQYIPLLQLKKEKEVIKQLKKELLTSYNFWNFNISLILVLLITLGNLSYSWLTLLLIFRTVSRSFEIIISFTLDIMEKERTSNLQSVGRLKLAIISYIELIILYTGSYAFFGYSPIKEVFDYQNLFNNFILSIGNITFTDVNFSYYFKEGTFYDLGEVKYLFILQVVTGFVLVIFAIASYIGSIRRTTS